MDQYPMASCPSVPTCPGPVKIKWGNGDKYTLLMKIQWDNAWGRTLQKTIHQATLKDPHAPAPAAVSSKKTQLDRVPHWPQDQATEEEHLGAGRLHFPCQGSPAGLQGQGDTSSTETQRKKGTHRPTKEERKLRDTRRTRARSGLSLLVTHDVQASAHRSRHSRPPMSISWAMLNTECFHCLSVFIRMSSLWEQTPTFSFLVTGAAQHTNLHLKVGCVWVYEWVGVRVCVFTYTMYVHIFSTLFLGVFTGGVFIVVHISLFICKPQQFTPVKRWGVPCSLQ